MPATRYFELGFQAHAGLAVTGMACWVGPLTVVLLLAIAGCSDDKSDESRAAPCLELPPPGEATLDDDITAMIASVGMPGVQTAVVSRTGVLRMKAYGKAVLAPLPETPMTPDTIQVVGSVSKTLVAIAVMQQVEAGALNLDEDIATGLPWPVRNPSFPDTPITWRMVLTHTSSINDIQEVLDIKYFGKDSPVPLSDIMRDVFAPGGQYRRSESFGGAPGTARIYSNLAVALAAYALELRLGQPFHAYVRERIINPIGMNRTSYFLADLPVELFAVPYRCSGGCRREARCDTHGSGEGNVLSSQYSFPDYPDGLLRTNARDYGKLMSMLLNGGMAGETAVLEATSIEELFTESIAASRGLKQGLIFFSLPGGTLWGHTGTEFGVAAAAFLDATSGVGALAFGNSQDFAESNEALMVEIVTRLLEVFR